MNQAHKNVTVYTTEPSKIIFNQYAVETVENKANLRVERKNEVINIVATTDSLTKIFEVEPTNSFMYWINIYCNYGIGILVDRNNPKRYSYPKRIYLNSADTIERYFRYSQSDHKGELHLHLSLPHVNSFRFTPENEGTKINTGFWGLTLGLDYFHSKNQFVDLRLSGVSDFFVPVPAAVDISGEYELMSSLYISFSNNHRIGRFTLGYGLSYAKNIWDFRYYDSFDPAPPTRDQIKRSHSSFGLIFPSYFQFGEHFNMGIVYRPTFFRTNQPDNFEYEHVISVDFAWKIRLI